jgi:hypothetical protein
VKKGILLRGLKMSRAKDSIKKLAQELDALDKMLTALVEILEEKGILTQEEWENKIQSKVTRAKGLTAYRDIQLSKD